MATKETKEVLAAIIELLNWTGDSAKDGNISIPELISLTTIYPTAKDAVEGIQNLPSEYASMSDEEKQDLLKFITEKFDIPQKFLEQIIEKIFEIIFSIERVVVDILKAKN